MGISSREDANKYYAQVSELVDKYMNRGEVKIRPSRVGIYLRPDSDNFSFFLKASGLSEVSGIDRVLKDVIEDLVAMEEDGVMTFESFNAMESEEFKITDAMQCLYLGINGAGQSHEQALADEFDTSLGHVTCVEPSSHEFRVDGWEGDSNAVVYSDEEVDIIFENFIQYSFGKAREISIEPFPDVKIKLDGMIGEEKFAESMYEGMKGEKFLGILARMIGKEFHVNKRLSGGKWFIFVERKSATS